IQEELEAWQYGRTGYPIVDAGMRQLWAIGWMHNRVRMIAASFLIKHLLIDWRHGERWFWDTLVDADYASNGTNWQWVAGCGPDAAPYFRVFNPETQQKKFDAEARYTRRWLAADSGFAEATPRAWNIKDTPRPLTPIVGLVEGRAAALAALERFKSRDLGAVD
ncbi:MAG: FAD-binding domain-containing protein, partial [Pseudomonadota bacterium]|nr:FAD-binding domain-containing protein [Pseudomonadota bacterium]